MSRALLSSFVEIDDGAKERENEVRRGRMAGYSQCETLASLNQLGGGSIVFVSFFLNVAFLPLPPWGGGEKRALFRTSFLFLLYKRVHTYYTHRGPAHGTAIHILAVTLVTFLHVLCTMNRNRKYVLYGYHFERTFCDWLVPERSTRKTTNSDVSCSSIFCACVRAYKYKHTQKKKKNFAEKDIL